MLIGVGRLGKEEEQGNEVLLIGVGRLRKEVEPGHKPALLRSAPGPVTSQMVKLRPAF